MKQPSAQMANKGISSYEHLLGSARRAHEGSQSHHPNSEKGANAGLGTGTMTSADNFRGNGGMHNLGM